MAGKSKSVELKGVTKCPTGITGFDDITGGGLPQGRPTLVCGSAGSGKTLFSMEFLLNGATGFNEPGVFISFEENEAELTQNVASLGWDLNELGNQKKIYLDHVFIDRREIEETGEFNLDGLFIRIEAAINTVKAKRIVIDTIEALFGGFTNEAILRAEVRRLFRWIKDKGLTAVITGEQGEKTFTRQGLEEYVSDCVIFLDNRMIDQIATRRLRVVKYRGTFHGTNEYPFLITEKGFSVFPITELGINYPVSTDSISSGIDRLDAMLGKNGFYKGSSILVSGSAGTGKSSLGVSFAAAACRRGERAIYFSFEESPDQILRNMASIGIDLKPFMEQGLLTFHSARATTYGIESHLVMMIDKINSVSPNVVVIDPISNLSSVANLKDVKEMLTRIVDFLKSTGVTALFTDLSYDHSALEKTEVEISSLVDTWILLRDIELNGERNRGMYILKSRGMHHSNQIREFLITKDGIDLKNVYIGPGGVLTGTARINQENKEKAEALIQHQKIERMRRDLHRRQTALNKQIEELQMAFDSEKDEIEHAISEAENRANVLSSNRDKFSLLRGRN